MKTEYLQLLEKYYNDEMDSADRAGFEKALSADPELARAFREYEIAMEAIRDKDMLDLRAKLKELREDRERRKQGGRFLNYNLNWMWLAALLVVIVCFTTIVSLMINGWQENQRYMLAQGIDAQKSNAALDAEINRYESRNINFVLLAPKDSSIVVFNNELVFHWTNDSVEALTFELISRNGQVVFKTRRPVTSPFVLKHPVPEGFYVLRFRWEDKSVFRGVLYLK
jgi:hypothetical protein